MISNSGSFENKIDEMIISDENILQAQIEAENEILNIELNIENSNNESIVDKMLPVPKLLQLGESDADISAMAAKTQDLMSRGKMLDLLVCKAESYSHFIKSNLQSPSSIVIDDTNENSSTANGKRKGSPNTNGSAKKSSKKEANSSKNSHLVSSSLCGELMEHQIDGLKWLASLWENGVNGILADEMGLGKTIQVISFIAMLRDRNTKGPFLIVAPLATIPNWIKEFKKWLPTCPVLLYHGNKNDRQTVRYEKMQLNKQELNTFPIIITSFEICMIDRPLLQSYNWKCLVVDEGHRIKNRNCRLIKELKMLNSSSRLLLSGTPIQNTLEELWSLLNFVNPMIFDSLEIFQSWFNFKNIGIETEVNHIIGQEQEKRIISKLHEILRPFLLRRMKKEILTDLPTKVEIVVYCGSSSLQQEYCKRIRDGTIRDTLIDMGIENAKDISLANPMMNLRKACNHPFLFGEPKDSNGEYIGLTNPKLLYAASGKFKLLNRLLPILKRNGNKVLIFSQMTKLLDILQDYIEEQKYQYCRIDGSIKVTERQERIELFNNSSNHFIFLLSTRAGGLGINLQSADTCILFDSDWNPHQDAQAQDRCHRIGQQKPVVVYRLLTVDSVDIEMMERQISKKKLDRLTIAAGNFGRVGERSGGCLTLRRLTDLLEDDVKNLSRKTTAGSIINEIQDCSRDISDEELNLITNRTKLFEGKEVISGDVEVSIPIEGDMYDVVSTSVSSGFSLSSLAAC